MRVALPLAIAAALAAGGAGAAEPISPVRLNQLGFEATAGKIAVAPNPATSPVPWKLVDAGGRVRASGATRVVGDDAASGEHLHQVDLGSFTSVGKGYRLQVGEAWSRPFAISQRPYAQLKSDALAYFYQTRSGIPIEARFVGDPKLARPAGHRPEPVTCFDKTDITGRKWPGCAYRLDTTGGWYDAGDQGKYVVNGGIAVWMLLNAYERAQARGTAGAFADGRSAIPEQANGVSDLLDEARWELEFLLSLQVPEGTRMALPVGHWRGGPPPFAEVDASGLVHTKVSDEHWTALPTAPQDDRETRYLYPPSTAATLNLAATAAQAARLWRTIDPAFSARCLRAARQGLAAARRNPEVYAWNGFTGSGGYGDEDVSDEFYWAAAELYVTTGDPAELVAARASPHFLTAPPVAWPKVATLATISLATVRSALPPADVARARAALVAAADRYLGEAQREGYHIPYSAPGYPWGSNSDVLNRGVVLAQAFDLTGKRAYRDGVVDAMDYVLGRNPLDQSYVTGYGARPMRNPHHRFWAQQIDPRYPAPPPGVLSGGPNNTAMTDPVASKLRGKCRPQTCWVDEAQAFTMNEVAINWNAPLFWLAAFLDER
jgi:endoglucanase